MAAPGGREMKRIKFMKCISAIIILELTCRRHDRHAWCRCWKPLLKTVWKLGCLTWLHLKGGGSEVMDMFFFAPHESEKKTLFCHRFFLFHKCLWNYLRGLWAVPPQCLLMKITFSHFLMAFILGFNSWPCENLKYLRWSVFFFTFDGPANLQP